MTTFRIRPAHADDLPALADVYRRASLSNGGDEAALLAHPDALVLSGGAVLAGGTRVATEPGGGVVGFATTRDVDGVFELDDLFVDPDWMRNGIATLLVRDIARIGRDQAIAGIAVTANPHALAFYHHAGFRPAGQTQTRFGPAPRMYLDLSADHPQ
ncbi:MAG: GNAT family N-acetyltransferase [Mycobacterium sp.]|nr:GNAT family N-acetyltransferase [Mycobacterium sp.]